MFSLLSICLSVNRITKSTVQNFMKFYGIVGVIQRPIEVKVKVTWGQNVKIIFVNNSVQIVVDSRHKIKAYSLL